MEKTKKKKKKTYVHNQIARHRHALRNWYLRQEGTRKYRQSKEMSKWESCKVRDW